MVEEETYSIGELAKLDEFAELLKPPPAASIADLESSSAAALPKRKRGVR